MLSSFTRNCPDRVANATALEASSVSFESPENRQSPDHGYLGPTSFVGDFSDGDGRRSNNTTPQTDNLRRDNLEVPLPSEILQPYWLTKTSELLGNLVHFPEIARLVRRYYDVSYAAIIPGPLVLSALGAIKTTYDEQQFNRAGSVCDLSFVKRVLHNSVQPLNVSPNTDVGSFCALFTGPQLRLEILGVLFSIAGRKSLFRPAPDPFNASEGSMSSVKFAEEMLAASDDLVEICKLLTPVNDLTLWLLYENLLLSVVLHGDSSRSLSFNTFVNIYLLSSL